MKAPIYLRKEPHGGAYLHYAFDKHLGYISLLTNAERIVAMVNAAQVPSDDRAIAACEVA